jgi:hypothetical protein
LILLITNKSDIHPNPVIEKLSGLGASIFRLNCESLLADYKFSWSIGPTGPDCILENRVTNLKIQLSEIGAVWERRPVSPEELPHSVNSDFGRVGLSEAEGFLRFFRYSLVDRFWVGNVFLDRRAESKILQLLIAHELGFQIPNTIFTNMKSLALEFFGSESDLLIKPIEEDGITIEEQEHAFFSRKFPKSLLSDCPDAAFENSVSFIQNYVPKACEVRVTCVKEKAFACKIDSQSQEVSKGAIDWRQGYGHGLKHTPIALPSEIEEFCFAFLKKMGTNFGCFDFIVTQNNEYVFLECNPNGQWLWIEKETGLPISDAIAKVLFEADRCHLKM